MLIFSKFRVCNDISLLLICVAKLIKQSNATFTVVVVVRGLMIVMLFANHCASHYAPLRNRRRGYLWYKTSNTPIADAFVYMYILIMVEMETNHLHGMRCHDLFFYPAQHRWCRIAVTTTTVQTVSWSILINTHLPYCQWWGGSVVCISEHIVRAITGSHNINHTDWQVTCQCMQFTTIRSSL